MHIRTMFGLKKIYAYLRMEWPIDRNIIVNAVDHNCKAALNEKTWLKVICEKLCKS